MKSRLLLNLLFATLPSLALAHPGHDGGHDFGWDFNGGTAHTLFSWHHLLPIVLAGLIVFATVLLITHHFLGKTLSKRTRMQQAIGAGLVAAGAVAFLT
jgi:lipoprotein signal peptidase